MKKQFFVGILFVLVMMMFAGCNIFSSFAPDDAESQSLDGLEALQDGDYEKAIENYLKVLEDEPNNADAHWGLAKAYLRQSGYTTVSIMTEISSFETEGALLPFMNDPIDSANALYEGVIKTNEHLQKIFIGDAVNEELDAEAIALDYTGTLALQGILLFRDTNGSGHIGDGDFDLNAQFNLNGDFDMDENTWDNLTPDQQDSMYAMLDDLLSNSSEALLFFLNSFMEDDSLEVGFDTENLGEVIDSILLGFEDFYFGGGGPGPESMIRPENRFEYNRIGRK